MAVKNKKPEIRFKGFAGDWEHRKFSETFTKISNNTLSRAELNYNSGLAKNIHYGDILIKFGELLDIKRDELPYITDDFLSNKFKSSKLQIGDVIMADAAEDEMVGKCTELVNVGEEIIVSGLHTIPSRPTQFFASGYLGYFMNSPVYHNQLLRLMQGTKVLSISKTTLQDTAINYPIDDEEQSQIGTFFKNLDHLLTLHQQKVNKLVTIKKAMLEKMFPKNGANVPEIRFKGFTEDWLVHKLFEITDIIGGGTPNTNNPEYWHGDIDWYSPTEIGKEIYANGSVKKITSLGFEKSSAKMLPPHKTVLFTSRAGIGDMAILKHPGSTNQGFQSFVVKDGVNSYFIYSSGHLIKEYALKHASGSTFLEISGKILGNMEIHIPNSNEQEKIGAFFAHLDNLITIHNSELEKLKNIKKAHLEKMFV